MEFIKHSVLTFLFPIFSWYIESVLGHARLLEPAGRSSLWRFNYKTPVNYNDNQLFCGGYRNTVINGGRCGACGDPYQGPYENEAGGKYAKGIINRFYRANETLIKATVDLSANHRGYFEFRLCPNNDVSKRVSQDCLDNHVLTIQEAEVKESHRFYPPHTGIFHLNLNIPYGLTCSQCVLQWKYTTGNFWGTDKRGESCIGCGPQELFVNCADIAIADDTIYRTHNNTTHQDDDHKSENIENKVIHAHDVKDYHQINNYKEKKIDNKQRFGAVYPFDGNRNVDQRTEQTREHTLIASQPNECTRCYALPTWNHYPHMDDWCETNCKKGYCPPCRCYCGCPDLKIDNPCIGKSKYGKHKQMGDWCWRECCESECPVDKCACSTSVKFPDSYRYAVRSPIIHDEKINDIADVDVVDKEHSDQGTGPLPPSIFLDLESMSALSQSLTNSGDVSIPKRVKNEDNRRHITTDSNSGLGQSSKTLNHVLVDEDNALRLLSNLPIPEAPGNNQVDRDDESTQQEHLSGELDPKRISNHIKTFVHLARKTDTPPVNTAADDETQRAEKEISDNIKSIHDELKHIDEQISNHGPVNRQRDPRLSIFDTIAKHSTRQGVKVINYSKVSTLHGGQKDEKPMVVDIRLLRDMIASVKTWFSKPMQVVT